MATLPENHTRVSGVPLSIRVENGGHTVDVVTSLSSLPHILLPLQEMFSKDEVPKGSLVVVETDTQWNQITFMCTDENDKLITPETAHIVVCPTAFLRVYNDEEGKVQCEKVELESEKQLEYVVLPPRELLDKVGLVRMIHVYVMAPKEMLSGMWGDFDESMNDDGDIELPLMKEWSALFEGRDDRSGLLLPDAATPLVLGETDRFRFRLGWTIEQEELEEEGASTISETASQGENCPP